MRSSRGAYCEMSSYGRGMVESIVRRMFIRASRAWSSVAADDLFADAADLQVELDAGDAVLRAGHLEVHVAVVVFVADDVGEQAPLAAGLRTPGRSRCPPPGCVIGTPADIRPSVAPQTVAIELRAVRFGDVRDDADRVRELFRIGQNRLHAPFGQRTVADFATTRSADRTALRRPSTTGSSSRA